MARAAQIKTPASRADRVERGPQFAEAHEAIPLRLTPLLAQFKKKGKISLRVERLPQQTRLSTGTRNSDGSWSLSPDELDDVEYLVPEGVDAGTAISVRIISLVGGDTLTVLQVPVVRGPAAEAKDAVAPTPAVDESEVKRLRDEIEQANHALTALEDELSEARAAAERTTVTFSEQATEALLAEARTTWNAEFEEKLAAATAKAVAEQKTQAADADAKLVEARARFEQDVLAALSKAEADWKTGESGRMASLEAQWKDKVGKLTADVDAAGVRHKALDAELKTLRVALTAAQAGAERGKGHEAELKALRDQVAAVQATIGERDAALTKAAAAYETARGEWERDGREALAKAEAGWKAAEAARFAEAEAKLRAEIAAAAPKTAPVVAAKVEPPKNDAEIAGLKARVTAVEGERDAAHAALSKAETEWKDKERALREAAAVVPPPAPPPAPAPVVDDSEVKGLREKLAAMQAERDAALARAVDAEEKAREADEALEAAAKAVKAKAPAAPPPAPAAAPAPAADSARVAEADARRATAEEALALARVRSREEIGALKATIAKRDEEIASFRARAGVTTSRSYENAVAAQPSSIRDFVNRAEPPAGGDKKTFFWEILVAVVLGAAGVILYPTIDAMIFGRPVVVRALPPLPRPKPELPAPVEKTALLSRDVKLRAEASSKSPVVVAVKGGASVVIVEARDDGWTSVRFDGKTGWMKTALLTPSPAPSASPLPASPPKP